MCIKLLVRSGEREAKPNKYVIALVAAVGVMVRFNERRMRIAGGRAELYVRGGEGKNRWTGEQIVMIVTEGRIQPATKRRINNNEPKRVCVTKPIKLKTVSGAAERDRECKEREGQGMSLR